VDIELIISQMLHEVKHTLFDQESIPESMYALIPTPKDMVFARLLLRRQDRRLRVYLEEVETVGNNIEGSVREFHKMMIKDYPPASLLCDYELALVVCKNLTNTGDRHYFADVGEKLFFPVYVTYNVKEASPTPLFSNLHKRTS
jgi:hypothetical protein